MLDDLVGRLATIEHRHLDERRARPLRGVRARPPRRARREARLGSRPRGGQGGRRDAPAPRGAAARARAARARPGVGRRGRAAAAAARGRARRRSEPARRRRHGGGAHRGHARASRSCGGARARRPIRPPSGATCTRSRASRSRALASRAVALSLGDDVPMQDFTSYLSVLLSNRATREEAWTPRARRASPRCAPRPTRPCCCAGSSRRSRRCPSAGTSTRSPPFLEAHPIDGAKQATAQTLERLRMDVALRERLAARGRRLAPRARAADAPT